MNFATGTVLPKSGRIILASMHMLVLAASSALLVWITRDTLQGTMFLESRDYRSFQFWMCMLFQIDILVEWAYSKHKWQYLLRHIFFILISIPYISIISFAGVHPSSEAIYLLSFVPMARSAFVFAIVVGAITSSRMMSTFYVYLIWVVASLFFAALMFYQGEHSINPQVDTIWTSLWWAAMSMSTAGCYVTPVTLTGKVLEVFLSAEGMMLIPVFTVYITRAVMNRQTASVQ